MDGPRRAKGWIGLAHGRRVTYDGEVGNHVIHLSGVAAVKKLSDLLFMALGAWIGWLAGSAFGIFGAFALAVVGTASGLYLSRRLAIRYLP